jgi:hypothetical protein
MTARKKDQFNRDEYPPMARRRAVKALRAASEALWQSFIWEDSKEGIAYWDKVTSRLHEIANQIDSFKEHP